MAGIAKPFSPEAALKRSIRAHLRQLGFTKDEAGELVLPGVGKDMIRRMHRGQRRERLAAAQPFLARALERALPSFAEGAEIDPAKIRLRLRLIKSDTPESDSFELRP